MKPSALVISSKTARFTRNDDSVYRHVINFSMVSPAKGGKLLDFPEDFIGPFDDDLLHTVDLN